MNSSVVSLDRFQISDFRSQISDLRSQISDFKFQISNLRTTKAGNLTSHISNLTSRQLTNKNSLVVVHRRSIRENHLVSLVQPAHYLYRADGLTPKTYGRAHSFAAIRRQTEYPDGLLSLSERRPPHMQNIVEAFQLNGSVHAEIRTRTRRQRANQLRINRKRALPRCWIDARHLRLNNSIPGINSDFLTNANVFNLCLGNS